jgi:hypothetical protein
MNSIFSNNTAVTGAGLCLTNTTLSLESVIFLGNYASYGSCIRGSSSNIQIIGGQYMFNTATYNDIPEGGAVIQLANASSIQVSGALFTDNVSAAAGGVFYLKDTTPISIQSSEFRRNSGGHMSGVVHASAGEVSLKDSIFDSNGIFGSPGGIGTGAAVYAGASVSEATLIDNCTFTNHFTNIDLVQYPYGTVYSLGRSAHVNNAVFANNSAYYAAGIYCGDAPSFSLKNSLFINNRATRGAAVVLDTGGPILSVSPDDNFLFENNVFESNSISPTRSTSLIIQGGAVHINGGGKVSLIRNIFRQNLINATQTTADVTNGVGLNIIIDTDSYFKIIGCQFLGNRLVSRPPTQSIGLGMRATLSVGSATFEIRDSLFKGNILEQVHFDNAYNGGSLALTMQTDVIRSVSPLSAIIKNCSFVENLSHTYPAMFFFSTNWQLEDSIIAHNGGGVSAEGGAIGSASDASRLIYAAATVQNCTFKENNQDFVDVYGTSTTDIIIRGDFCPKPGQISLHDLTLIGDINFETILATPARVLNNIILVDCAQLISQPAPGAAAGSATRLPTIFMVGGAIIDVQNVTATILSLYATRKTVINPVANHIYVGAYDFTLSNRGVHAAIAVVIHGILGAPTGPVGSIVIKSLMEASAGDQIAIYNCTIRVAAGGSLTYFALPRNFIELDNGHVVVETGAELVLAHFVNPSVFRGARASSIQVYGNLTLSNGLFDAINFSLFPTASVRYVITNFWPPTTMQFLNGSTASMAGARITFDFSFINPTTAPTKNQLFGFANSTTTAGGLVTSGLTVTDTGGFSVENVTSLSSLSVRVIGFYPSSMQIADDGATLDLVFPLLTNAPASRDCSGILSASTLVAFSDTVECGWKSESRLSIRTSVFASNVSLVPGAIWDKRDVSFFSQIPSKEMVLPPTSPLAPVVHISGPNTHPSCASLILDASNSYYVGDLKKAIYKWSLISHSSTHPVAVELASELSARVVLPSASLSPNETYIISISITNAFGLTASANITVSILEVSFSVAIEGPDSRTSLASSPLRLYGIFDVPAGCSLSSSSIERKWTVSGGSLPSSVKSDDFSLDIPASALAGNKSFIFTFTAWPSGSPGLASSQKVDVFVIPSPLSVSATGTTGLLSTSASAQIIASLMDPDMSATNSSVSWSWSIQTCPGISDFSVQSLSAALAQSAAISLQQQRDSLNSTKLCLGSTGSKFNVNAILNLRSRVLDIPANLFGNGEVILSVSAVDTVTGRAAGAVVYLNFSSSIAGAQVRPIGISSPSSVSGNILPQEKLVLRACVNSSCVAPANVRFQWKSTELGKSIPASGTHLAPSKYCFRFI